MHRRSYRHRLARRWRALCSLVCRADMWGDHDGYLWTGCLYRWRPFGKPRGARARRCAGSETLGAQPGSHAPVSRSVMNTLLVALGIMAVAGSGSVASAETSAGDGRNQFRFEFEQTTTLRGLAVEGWVYNGLAWRISNVRVRVDCLDANEAVTASASGWVQGDVPAEGRAHFYVPISSPAATYRVRVQSFDRVERAPQAP